MFSSKCCAEYCIIVHAQSLSCVPLFVTPWTVAHQAHLPMGFPRQECWSGLPFPPPWDLPHTGIKSASPALAGGILSWRATRESPYYVRKQWKKQTFQEHSRRLDTFQLWFAEDPFEPKKKKVGAFEAYRERWRERGSFQADNWTYRDRELGSVRIYQKKEEFIGILMGSTEKIKYIWEETSVL